jgi:hypothetical protein
MLPWQIEASRYDPGRDGSIDHTCHQRRQLVQSPAQAPWDRQPGLGWVSRSRGRDLPGGSEFTDAGMGSLMAGRSGSHDPVFEPSQRAQRLRPPPPKYQGRPRTVESARHARVDLEELGGREEGRSPLPSHLALGRLPLVAFVTACGVMIVALAFAASRANSQWAPPLFWFGQVIVYAGPAILVMVRRPITRLEALGLAWLLPLATYVITVAYSPLHFIFVDEFAHVRTAQSILITHHLFVNNPADFVSPQYPGLEIVTTALASLAHLSVFVSGLIVVGVAHVLLGLGVYFLILEITHRRRLAALAVLAYATGPNFKFFDSYFIYEALALPFMVACLFAAVKMLRETDQRTAMGWGLAACFMAASTVVTHHITSYFLVIFLVIIEGAQLLRGREQGHLWRLPALIAATLALILLWDFGVASLTVLYFSYPIAAVVETVRHFGHGVSVTLPRAPLVDLALEYSSILLLCALAAIGIRHIWRSRSSRSPLILGLAIASLGLFAALVFRLLGAEGSQLYGRATSFFMVPVSLAVAFTLRSLHGRRKPTNQGLPRRRPRIPRPWIGVAAILLLALGGITLGEPPYYARLPGSFLVEAWERSVDQHNLDLSEWAATELPINSSISSDSITSSLLDSIGHQEALYTGGGLFVQSELTASAQKLVRKYRIEFVVVDKRLAAQLPEDGYYFGNQTSPNLNKLPLRDLRKFNHIAGVSRIFNDGTISVYALAGSLYTTTTSGK